MPMFNGTYWVLLPGDPAPFRFHTWLEAERTGAWDAVINGSDPDAIVYGYSLA